MKTYKVVIENTNYSKKSGTIRKLYTLLKGATIDECRKFILKTYNVKIDGFECYVKGNIYPTKITIK